MNKILEMREKRAKLWEGAKAFLDSKQDKNGILSAEDSASYDKMEADIVAMGKEIERLERQKAIEDELNSPISKPITNQPTKDDDEPKGRKSKLYTTSFWNMMRTRSGQPLTSTVSNALQENVDAEGGYLVPDEYEKTLIEALEEENIFRQLATTITTSSGDRKIPVVATKGTASWIDEEGSYPESDDTFSQITIGAYKLATMMKVSEELLNDSAFNLESYIATEFSRRIGRAEEEAFITGNGTGKPTGVLTTAQIGQNATSSIAITMDDVMDLYYSLKAPYRAKAKFIVNDSTVKVLRKLKDANEHYIWEPSVKEGEPDRLLNKPIYTSVYMPEIGSNNKIIAFGDYSYYWIADRQARRFRQLNELFAPTGQVGFLASERVDGKLTLAEAVKTLKMGA